MKVESETKIWRKRRGERRKLGPSFIGRRLLGAERVGTSTSQATIASVPLAGIRRRQRRMIEVTEPALKHEVGRTASFRRW